MSRLHALLRDLVDQADTGERLANDPVRFVHRYDDPADQEVAAFLAAGLAYGRVSLFSPVVAAVLDRADARGGPAAWVRELDPEAELHALAGLYYRWTRGADLVWSLAGMQAVLREHGSLGALVEVRPGEPHIGPAISRLVQTFRATVLDLDALPDRWEHCSRGLRWMLVDPADGSAAKRLMMLARWLVRPADGVDLGLWTHVHPRHLVMPLDTHVHRISQLVGLTSRRTASWRAAVELTEALRALDPLDPVRFDFALAHLGISGGCQGRWEETVCRACALRPACLVGSRAG